MRSRAVTRQPSCNGTPCPSLREYNPCTGPCCPRDCTLSQWSSWGTCNAPGGSCAANAGSKSRTRTVVRAQSCGGSCPTLRQTGTCTRAVIQCQFNTWSTWSSCSPTNGNCGSGTQRRTRTVRIQPQCSSPCSSITSDTRACVHSCCPVNCVMSSWGQWDTCSSTCGTGLQSRRRSITTQPSCNGNACPRNLVDTRNCNRYVNVDCQHSLWTSWSQCSTGCGSGIQTRSRSITVHPRCNGRQCGPLTERKQCQSYRDNQDCRVSSWGTWSSCNTLCSTGTKSRTRVVTRPQRCRGAGCPSLKDTASCGLTNGGCQHVCNNGSCSCYPGYNTWNRTHCIPKDCGHPTVNYCPQGMANGTVCLQPSVVCPAEKTTFPTTCTLSCVSTHTLKGPRTITCQTDGTWSNPLTNVYCRRINDPPSDIVLSGSGRIQENKPRNTYIGTFSSVDPNANNTHTYSIYASVTANMGKFQLIGANLHSLVKFDYESGPKRYSVGVKSTDNGNPPLSFSKLFTIIIDDVNEKPTGVSLSSTSIDENSDKGTVVGNLDTIDQDVGQQYSYQLLDSGGGLFQLSGNSLQASKPNGECLNQNSSMCPLDCERKPSHKISIRSTDNGSPSLSVVQNFSINVRDVNDPPCGIQLSANTVKENAPTGTEIGVVSAYDEDRGQSLKYTLVNDDGGKFKIWNNGSLMKANGTDYETQKVHKVKVRVTDNGVPPISRDKEFFIGIQDVNERPVTIKLSDNGSSQSYPDDKALVPENSKPGYIVGTLAAYDQDYVLSISFFLDDSANGRFTLSNTTSCKNASLSHTKTICNKMLLVAGSLNYEVSSSHTVMVRVQERDHSLIKSFTINLVDMNDRPRGILINGKVTESIRENIAGAAIGTLTTIDDDRNQTYTFRLVNNPGGKFAILGNYFTLASGVSLDYEAAPSYDITLEVSDSGTPSLSFISNVTVNVLNVNEAPTDIVLTGLKVTENSPPGTLVANISVTDPDDKTSPSRLYHSCVLTNTAGGRFQINGDKLIVGSASINYEANKLHNITIRCSDQALSATKTFTVTVIDINEKPTSIKLSSYSIEENLAGQIVVGVLSTTDPDNEMINKQSFVYRLTGANASNSLFRIQGNSLICTRPLDYEFSPMLRVSIVSTDNGSPAMDVYQTLNVQVVDKNDVPQDILLSSNYVAENCNVDTFVGTLSTVDEDMNQNFTYQLTNSSDGRFKIEGNALKVAVPNKDCLDLGGYHCKLNYEANKQHVITVTTTDNGSPPKSYQKDMTIYVRDKNDRPRNIRLSNYTVAENAPVNTIIGRFRASDEDNGQRFTFRLASNDSGRFGVDASGNLYKASNDTNYETKTSHHITVVVKDNGVPPMEAQKSFVIEVLDVNEAPIQTALKSIDGQLSFPDNQPQIKENSRAQTCVGTVVSYDSDSVETLQLRLDDDAFGLFKLDSKTNCSNVTNIPGFRSMCSRRLLVNGKLNYENKSSHTIIVRSTDNQGLFRVSDFNIRVTDVNDKPTDILLAGQSYAIVKEHQAGTMIEDVTTIDEDIGQQYFYTVLGNNSAMYNMFMSWLFLNRGVEFDYEKQASHTVTLKSTDNGTPPLSVTKIIELRVEDVNEAPTDIILSKDNVTEDSPIGAVVGSLTVMDPDNMGSRGSWQSHVCSVGSGGQGMFKITRNNLVVAQAGLDFERTTSYNLSVRCEDSGSPKQSLEKWFIINIVDLNEKPIKITISTNVIDENTPAGGIGALTTTDPDNFNSPFPDKQQFMYSIQNNINWLPFIINGSILQSTRPLDYENTSQWNIRVRTTDNGIPPMFTEDTITINVTDVNETPKKILLSNKVIKENCPRGTVVGKLSTEDQDANQTFLYTLVDSDNGIFKLDNDRIEVAENNRLCLVLGGDHCKLNYERSQNHTIRVKTTDSGKPPLSYESDFYIHLTDVNDRPRNLRLSSNEMPENATKGYIIGKFSCDDEDLTQSNMFNLTDDDGGRFGVDRNGNLYKIKETDYESRKLHKVTIQVTDNGVPPMSISKEFTIIIKDINEAPANLRFTQDRGQLPFPQSSPRVKENSAGGTIVGTLFAIDQDQVESLKFTLDNDAGGKFRLDPESTCMNTTTTPPHTNCKTVLRVAGSLDFEVNAYEEVAVRVTDNNGLSHSQNFNISIVDQNDKPTNITLNGGLIGYVNENLDNTLVGRLEAEDEDVGQSHSYQLVDNAGLKFILSQKKIYTAPHAGLNYEQASMYTITVQTTDSGYPQMSFNQTFIIKIVDVNEAPSSIALPQDTVNENSPVGTEIGNISVSDPDNEGRFAGRQMHTCTLTFDASGTFGIRHDTTLFVKKAALDFEFKHQYTLNVRCTDTGNPQKSLERNIQVNIRDVNEAPTSIMLSSGTVAENMPLTMIGRLYVTDPDRTTQTHACKVLYKTSQFRVFGTALKTVGSLNYEIKNEYIVPIQAVDQGGLSVVENFTIHVQDENDAPSNIQFSGPLSFPENSPSGTYLGTAAAVDEDASQTHTYSIVSVIASGHGQISASPALQGHFQIERSSGRILLANGTLDYEEFTEYNITINATDNGSPQKSVTKTVVVSVSDVNHPPTDILSSGNTVTENSLIGTLVSNLTVIDPENRFSVRQTHTCSVIQQPPVPFTIAKKTRLVVNGSIDAEKINVYSVKVKCVEDSAQRYSIQRTFVITVNDINEAPRNITLTPSSVDENNNLNATVGVVTAIDPDNEVNHVNNVTLALLSGLDSTSFILGDGNNLLTLQTFNYENKQTYSVRLKATDNGSPSLSSEQTIVIRINDVNDRPTDILLSSQTITENAALDTEIGMLTTTDQDANQTYTYTFDTSIAEAAIQGNKLIVGSKLDYETLPYFNVSVKSTDSGTPPLSVQKSFTISVTDQNDAPSDILVTTFSVLENITTDQIVATLEVIDQDSSQTHVCSVTQGPSSYFDFRTDPSSGNITMSVLSSAPLDYETQPEITVSVQCTDNGSPRLSVVKNITITILDANEAPLAVLINGNSTVSIKENSPVGSVVGQLSCKDPDGGQSHSFIIEVGIDTFEVVSNTNLLKVKNNSLLNYEALPSSKIISVSLTCTDSGNPQLSKTGSVSIILTDVNEPPTNIRLARASTRNVFENLTVGDHIGELVCDDPESSRQLISYQALNWQQYFTVARGQGKTSYLTLNSSLDYDMYKSYTLEINATDNGVPPLSSVGSLAITVIPTDPCHSGELNCSVDAKCQRINKTHGNCGCLPGYFDNGKECENINDCKASCDYCYNIKDACKRNIKCAACKNGTCHDKVMEYKCTCDPGFTSFDCSIGINDCDPNPCQNEGQCFDEHLRYRCECIEGYNGTNCEINIDECASQPCVSGTCIDLVAGFSCQCPKDTFGVLCNRRKEDCGSNACSEGKKGVCVAPAYTTAKDLAKGGKEPVCATEKEIVRLSISSTFLPVGADKLNKWKNDVRQFIMTSVGIPYYEVDLSEEKSNGGVYYPTDVTFFAFKSEGLNVQMPFVVQVNPLVPRDAFLLAANKSCSKITKQSDFHYLFCSSVKETVIALGLHNRGKPTVTKPSTSGFQILAKKNLYYLSGAIAGLILIVVIALIVRARKRRSSQHRDRALTDRLDLVNGNTYFDAMERHHKKRVEDSYGEATNPIYGVGEDEVGHHEQKMFANPLFGRDSIDYDALALAGAPDYPGADDDIKKDPGYSNPLFGAVVHVKGVDSKYHGAGPPDYDNDDELHPAAIGADQDGGIVNPIYEQIKKLDFKQEFHGAGPSDYDDDDDWNPAVTDADQEGGIANPMYGQIKKLDATQDDSNC